MTVSNYEEAKRLPEVDVLVRIATVTGKSFDWLLTGREKEKNGPADILRISESEVAQHISRLRKASEVFSQCQEMHKRLASLVKDEGEKMEVLDSLLEEFSDGHKEKASEGKKKKAA